MLDDQDDFESTNSVIVGLIEPLDFDHCSDINVSDPIIYAVPHNLLPAVINYAFIVHHSYIVYLPSWFTTPSILSFKETVSENITYLSSPSVEDMKSTVVQEFKNLTSIKSLLIQICEPAVEECKHLVKNNENDRQIMKRTSDTSNEPVLLMFSDDAIKEQLKSIANSVKHNKKRNKKLKKDYSMELSDSQISYESNTSACELSNTSCDISHNNYDICNDSVLLKDDQMHNTSWDYISKDDLCIQWQESACDDIMNLDDPIINEDDILNYGIELPTESSLLQDLALMHSSDSRTLPSEIEENFIDYENIIDYEHSTEDLYDDIEDSYPQIEVTHDDIRNILSFNTSNIPDGPSVNLLPPSLGLSHSPSFSNRSIPSILEEDENHLSENSSIGCEKL